MTSQMWVDIGNDIATAWSKDFCKVIKRVGPGVWMGHFRGQIPYEAFQPTMAQMRTSVLQGEHIAMIGDGDAWTGYDSAYRTAWIDWFRDLRGSITECASARSLSDAAHGGVGGEPGEWRNHSDVR